MSYNSAEINEFSDIWVFCEQRDGKLMNTDFELVSEGRKLADERFQAGRYLTWRRGNREHRKRAWRIRRRQSDRVRR